MDSIAISAVIAIVVVVGFYYYFKNNGSTASTSNGQVIQNTITDGKKPIDTAVALPLSFDQKQGLTFSYTCWVKIDDFSYRYGEQKVIFSKGPTDLSMMCPALLVDATTNALLIKIDTFGTQEVIPISNIPAKKWLHVAIAVNQEAADVYINGTLYTHHTLAQIPKQNSGTVHTGVKGGFDGKIASLQYYNIFLTPQDVVASMGSKPEADPGDVGVLPPYFDASWWTNH